MFRVCDADVLMTPGNAVFYVVKDRGDEEFDPEVLVEDALTSAHRVIDVMIIHNDPEETTGLPVISYVVKDDEIHAEPKAYNVITSDQLLEILEFDDEITTIDIERPGLVVAITIERVDNHNIVHVKTADKIIQPAR